MLDKLKTKIRDQTKYRTEEQLFICRDFQSKLEICRACGCYVAL